MYVTRITEPIRGMSAHSDPFIGGTIAVLGRRWKTRRVARDSTRHDPETIALGRARIAEIRAQLPQRRSTSSAPSSSAIIDPPTRRETIDVALPADESWSPERMAAAMAAGSERSQLQQRVVQLETEVAQLRAALADVLTAAANGLQPSTTATEPTTEISTAPSGVD